MMENRVYNVLFLCTHMALLGWLFVATLFRGLLPGDQIDSYIAGLILLARLQPVSLVALLATLVLLFGFQGEQVLAQPLVILLLAVPILIQVYCQIGLGRLEGVDVSGLSCGQERSSKKMAGDLMSRPSHGGITRCLPNAQPNFGAIRHTQPKIQ